MAPRPEEVELVAGPHDGVRLTIARFTPVIRMPSHVADTLILDGTVAVDIHLYARTAGRTFDGVPCYLYKGVDPGPQRPDAGVAA